jgi:hypothetical protein
MNVSGGVSKLNLNGVALGFGVTADFRRKLRSPRVGKVRRDRNEDWNVVAVRASPVGQGRVEPGGASYELGI